MRVVIQRVKEANVKVDKKTVGEISQGLLVYVGFTFDDDIRDIEYISEKILNLRIFSDEEGKMNISLKDVDGELLIISQFTLYGDIRKGRRPSFSNALSGDKSEKLYNEFLRTLEKDVTDLQKGIFGADMEVSSINDGPVTILLDSSKLF